MLNKDYSEVCHILRSVYLWFHLEYISPISKYIIVIHIWQLAEFLNWLLSSIVKAVMMRMDK